MPARPARSKAPPDFKAPPEGGRGRGALASILLALVLVPLAGGPARAEGEPPLGRVALEVTIAHGLAEPGGGIDPGCQRLSQRLPISFGTIRMITHKRFDLPMGERAVVHLPSGEHLTLLPIQVIQRRLHLQYEIPGSVNTRLRLTSGRPMIFGGPRLREGQMIIEVMPSFETVPLVAEPVAPKRPAVEKANAER